MLKNINFRGHSRNLTKVQKLSLSGVAAVGAAAIAITAMPGQSQAAQSSTTQAAAAQTPATFGNKPVKDIKASVTDQKAGASLKAEAAVAKQKAAQERKGQESVSRSTERVELQPVAAKTYANNLDGWIRQSLDIMRAKGIPGSYHGLHKNIMRESSGNPMAINNWDINARNGIPSKGLLQVIQPTFNAYHVAGTSKNIYDPVANITAAANYAADRYGSIDNVNSAY
ncbi:transglycosylase SLT domain-containing protein [Streptomyces colonosanans]|uniref:Lytic transglycosylase n=1 Tax=Streptomyces colonosanans TaxID=1428652 RepID=A0A1S2NXU3_9ACTN|nr:transglycosylase SLT domain-containing protein [Streptomyces colonosanans]OIJ86062.1 lytic transglycosylase [Streptomyces colonosanans]